MIKCKDCEIKKVCPCGKHIWCEYIRDWVISESESNNCEGFMGDMSG